MKLDENKWKEAFKKAASDLAKALGSGPSDGEVCAVATIRYIRDGLKAEKVNADVQLNELIQYIQRNKLHGFASNSSSAAGACGLKVDAKKADSFLSE